MPNPPIIENIPLELRQRRQWVCWAIELRNGKPTKVPYTPGTVKKARSNSPATWASFEAAYASYLSNPVFFAGIGYEFSKDDPYTGVDFDHCIDEQGVISEFARAYLPHTYAEISQSGAGIKAIARATVESGRKTPNVEVYDNRRFFAITGNVVAGMPRVILPAQPAIDRILDVIGTPAIKDGKPGCGSRSERVSSIPVEDWEAGRQLRRKGMGKLLSRLRSSAVSKKTRKPDTQLAYLLKEDYRGFHTQWPHVGIVRGDGSIDSSQIRAVMASSIKMRGFSFPEFAALMSYFFGVECAAKWGTKQGVQQEIATLWFIGRSPRVGEYEAEPVQPAARGRAGDRASLLERAYETLVSFKAGIEALLTVQDLADALGVHPRTASGLLADLVAAKRIQRRKAGQYGGLVVSFPDTIIAENKAAYSNDTNRGNGESPPAAISADTAIDHVSEVIYSEIEVGGTVDCNAENTAPTQPAIGADASLLSNIYITSTVFLPDTAIMSEKRVSLRDTVALAFDELPKNKLLPTGELKKWPVTQKRIAEYVAEQGDWPEAAISFWIDKERKRRKAATFDDLKNLKRDALEKRAATVRKRIEHAEKRSLTAELPELRAWYKKEAGRLEGQRALLAWELKRRDDADSARIDSEGYSAGEQQEMLDLVERERRDTGGTSKRVSLPNNSSPVPALVERLKALKHGS